MIRDKLQPTFGGPFQGCDRVSVVFSSDAVARGWPKLFEEQRSAIEREIGASFTISDTETDPPHWLIRCSSNAVGPTLKMDRARRVLLSEGRTLDEVEETFSFLRSLERRRDGEWVIDDCKTVEEAADRLAAEIRTSYPAFELRNINWDEVCGRYRRLLVGASDPISVMQAWTAELQDAHTWVRPNPPLGELPYGLWTNGETATFRAVPEDSEGFAQGVRAGFKLHDAELSQWWSRTAGTPHMKPFLVGRRLLAAPIGASKTLTAESPNGRIVSWTETVRQVSWEPLVTWTRLKSGNGYLRIRAFIETSTFDDQLQEAFEGLSACPILIVDLRGNPGGKLVLAQSFRNRFLRSDGVMGFLRSTAPDGRLSETMPIQGAPAPEKQRWKGAVRFLTDAMTYSASEDALLGLQGLPHVQVVGQPSGGGSGRVRLVRLLPGYRLTVSTALTFDRNRRCIEGNGIPTDASVPLDQDSLLFADKL